MWFIKSFPIIFISGLLGACQSPQIPQNTADLLALADQDNGSICTVSLAAVRETMTGEELASWAAEMSDMTKIAAAHPGDYVVQIRQQLRRGALNRRLNVTGDQAELAQEFYDEFDDGIGAAASLTDHHDKLHYWTDRANEQSGFKDEPDRYNMRFCVLNEARAKVHADNRAFLLANLSNGPSADMRENISHEYIMADDFRAHINARLYTPEFMAGLSPLERSRIRVTDQILTDDPQTSQAFLRRVSEEVEAFKTHIQAHDYDSVSDKLADMTAVDQMIRKMFTPLGRGDHFYDTSDRDAVTKGMAEMMGQTDEFNTGLFRSMLDGRGWFRDDQDGEGAGSRAWLLAQHADHNPEFQDEALKLMAAELGAPGVSKSNYAYLFDRVQARWSDGENTETRKQRYGTQGRCVGKGKWEPLPLEDPGNVDALRAEMELGPIADYKARFKDICFDAD